MKMNIDIKLILLLFLFPFLISCEKEAMNVKIPNDSKLVISSFISPDVDTIRVYVTESEPAVGGDRTIDRFAYYKDATVILSDGNQFVELTYKKEFDSYYGSLSNSVYKGVYVAPNTGSFKIEYGKTYYLEVTDPKGRKATANCTVPNKVNYNSEPQFELRDNTTDIISDDGYDVYISWNDIPDQTNYFRIKDLYIEYSYPCIYLVDGTKQCTDLNGDPIISKMRYGVNFISDVDFIEDSKNPNGVLSLKGQTFKSYSSGYDKGNAKDATTSFKYTFIQMDEHYYQYMKSSSGYIDPSVPFVEPTLIYSNVEGGLGIFGAYTVLVDKSK